MRANLNRALAFTGLSVAASGELSKAEKVERLGQAERRARELREDLASRGVHPDVMRFCRQELLQDNYFHAVLEAVKSIAAKVRSRTGLVDDGRACRQGVFGDASDAGNQRPRDQERAGRAERLRQSAERDVRDVPQPHRT